MRYLLLAAAIHITLTTAIFFIGHFRVLPNTFDENGVGLTFAIDGTSYQKVATDLVTEWQTNGFSAWLNAKAPFHCRLQSLSFVTFGKLLGHNILGAEPLNLLFYLAILSCIYLLGREIFNPSTGFVAAAIVGLWPTFLLHSTQLIRDPLFISCFLALMLLLTLSLSREFAWRASVGLGIAGAGLATLLWVARGNMWNLVVIAVALALAMLALRMIRERKFMAGNTAVLILIMIAVLSVPARLESTTLPGAGPPVTPLAIPSASQPTPSQSIWTRSVKQIGQRRAGFRSYQSRASNIDSDVQLNSTGDVLKFIPRALVVGFFAPFPRMWVEKGNFGRAGRILTGLETLAMYFLYLAVAMCLWRERRNEKVWFLFVVAGVGILALGLVVVNAAALYRIRYVFWILLIVIAAECFSRKGAKVQS